MGEEGSASVIRRGGAKDIHWDSEWKQTDSSIGSNTQQVVLIMFKDYMMMTLDNHIGRPSH